jgi:hypothetical protein
VQAGWSPSMRRFARMADLVPVFPVVAAAFVPVVKRPVIYRDIPLVIGFADVNYLWSGASLSSVIDSS